MQPEVKPLCPDGARIKSQVYRKSMNNHQLPRRVPHSRTTLLGQSSKAVHVSLNVFLTQIMKGSQQ